MVGAGESGGCQVGEVAIGSCIGRGEAEGGQEEGGGGQGELHFEGDWGGESRVKRGVGG